MCAMTTKLQRLSSRCRSVHPPSLSITPLPPAGFLHTMRGIVHQARPLRRSRRALVPCPRHPSACSLPASLSPSSSSSSSFSRAYGLPAGARAERPQPAPYERVEAQRPNPAYSRDVYVVPFGEGARHLLINRPAALNALNLSMVRRLSELLQALDADKDVGIVLLSGKGGKAFCAGGDVRALHDAGKRRKDLHNATGDSDLTKAFFMHEYSLNFRLHCTRFPLVAVMNGITMGGGVGLAGHLRYRVATPQTLLAMPECSIGFFPDVGSSFLLPRLHHPYLGHYLGLTGARLKGYDLLHAGLATHWVEHDDWASQVETAFSRTGLTWHQAEDAVENVFWHLCAPEEPPAFSLSVQQLEIIAEAFSKETMEAVVQQLEARRDSSSTSSTPMSAPPRCATCPTLVPPIIAPPLCALTTSCRAAESMGFGTMSPLVRMCTQSICAKHALRHATQGGYTFMQMCTHA